MIASMRTIRFLLARVLFFSVVLSFYQCSADFDTCSTEWKIQLLRVAFQPACRVLQSTVGKKMVAVHFTTILCKPNTAYMAQTKPNVYNICSYTKDIVQPRFEESITFLHIFMNVAKVYVR